MSPLVVTLAQLLIIYGPGFVRDLIALMKTGNVTIDQLDALFNEGLKNTYEDYIKGTNTPIVIPPTGVTP
jgi:hypothetical protein